MKLPQLILLLVAISVSGCDPLHVKQYRITGVTRDSQDAAKLKGILQNVADKTELKDYSSSSRITNSFVYYSKSNYVGSVPQLSAWFYKDDVWIQIYGGRGTPPEYKQAKKLLQPTLSAEFGSRFSIPSEPFSRIESAEQKN